MLRTLFLGAVAGVFLTAFSVNVRGQETQEKKGPTIYVVLGCSKASDAIELGLRPEDNSYDALVASKIEAGVCEVYQPAVPVTCAARVIELEIDEYLVAHFLLPNGRDVYTLSKSPVPILEETCKGLNYDRLKI